MSTLQVATIKSDTLTPPIFKNSNNTEIGTMCRAWVNFKGTGTVVIRAGFNVSSITDNGTGDYTVNFTNAMPDANYCAVVPTSPAIGVTLDAGAWFGGVATDASGIPITKTTSAIRIKMAIYTGPGGSYDSNEVNLSIFR
jgi:hypothetical protein